MSTDASPAAVPLLQLTGITAGYGSGLILRGVDLTVHTGQVTCLIGPNGAGKSTVLKAVSGLLRPKGGTVTVAGDDVTKHSPRQKLLRGVVHVPQDRSLFPAMTVWDNLLMGGYLIKSSKLLRQRIDEATALFPLVLERRNTHAGSLSGGEQKQVELARTMLFDPKLILLDEPSIGLDPKGRRSVFAAIRTLAEGNRTVLLVEQNARSGLAASDDGAVLEAGSVRLTGRASQLLNDPDVARLYLGAAAHGTTTLSTAAPAATTVKEQS